MTTNNTNDEDLELFKKYQTTKVLDQNGKLVSTDTKLRNNLAERNARLVTFVINKFYNKKPKHKELRSDLLQEGHLGLFDAIDGFKPELGFKFSTYACWWIRQSVNSFLLDEEPMLHIPSHVRTARNKLCSLAKEQNMTFKDLGQKDLQSLGMTDKMFSAVKAALKVKTYGCSSLYEPVSSSGFGRTLQDIIPSNELDLSEQADNSKLVEAAKAAFALLDLREKCVLLERYGLDCSGLLKEVK